MNPQPKPIKQPKARKPWGSAYAPAPKLRDQELQELPTVKPLVRGTYGGGVSGIALAKAEKLEGGKDERLYKDSLAAIGCVCCHRLGLTSPSAPIHAPVELHHLRGGGWGKGDYRTLIPLCPEHHRGATGIHGLGTKGFAKQNGFDQQDLLDDALALLANRPSRAE